MADDKQQQLQQQQPKHILVTGGRGFLGSLLVATVLEKLSSLNPLEEGDRWLEGCKHVVVLDVSEPPPSAKQHSDVTHVSRLVARLTRFQFDFWISAYHVFLPATYAILGES